MKDGAKVVIVGGGVIGLTCAYQLAREGWQVSVWDRGALGQEASWAGAGIIPPGRVEGATSCWDRLRAIGATSFPHHADELRELTGIDIGYRRCGGLEFLPAATAAEVTRLWAAEGIPFEAWPAEQCQRREPAVVPPPDRTVWYLPGCAQVRNPWLLRALIAGCERRGVVLQPYQEVVALAGRPPRAEGIMLADGRRVLAERILLTAGAWTDGLLHRSQGQGVGIYPVRGQIVLLRTTPGLLQRIVIVDKCYLVPRGDGHLLIGSTEEPEAGFAKGTTAGAVASLLAFAAALVPRLAQAELVKCWSGLRPGSRDGWPVIGPLPGWDNVWIAAGHFRAGIQLSLGTAQVIAEAWGGRTPCVSLAEIGGQRRPSDGPRAFRS